MESIKTEIGVKLTDGRLANQMFVMAHALKLYGRDVTYILERPCSGLLKILDFNHIQYKLYGTVDQNHLVDGVFNVYQFWKEQDTDVIKNCLTCPDDIKTRILEKYPDISNIVILHIRLGDYLYLSNSHIYNILNYEYVSRVINKYYPNDRIIMISDDLPLANQLFPGLETCDSKDELFDFYLMTMSKGNICSASSYSILACYYNDKGINVAPYPLFKVHETDASGNFISPGYFNQLENMTPPWVIKENIL